MHRAPIGGSYLRLSPQPTTFLRAARKSPKRFESGSPSDVGLRESRSSRRASPISLIRKRASRRVRALLFFFCATARSWRCPLLFWRDIAAPCFSLRLAEKGGAGGARIVEPSRLALAAHADAAPFRVQSDAAEKVGRDLEQVEAAHVVGWVNSMKKVAGLGGIAPERLGERRQAMGFWHGPSRKG